MNDYMYDYMKGVTDSVWEFAERRERPQIALSSGSGFGISLSQRRSTTVSIETDPFRLRASSSHTELYKGKETNPIRLRASG